MEQTKRHRATAHGFPIGRLAGAAIAVGAVSTSAFALGSAGASTSHATKSVVVSTTKNSKLGTLLVSGGRTLYTLKASKVACSTQCLQIWPALMLPKGVTKATAGSGASASKLGTVARSGGALQVTYGGKALYWFSGDKAAGQVHGNITDTWGSWSDVVTVKPKSGSSTSSGTGSGAGSGGSNTGTGGVAF